MMEIDLVYLWVDGNDPVWLAKKNAFLPADQRISLQAAGDCRYVQNDELRYSLRSAEMYVPWIRRIYIVTDNQVPEWLDTSNPRIRVIFHSEFIPAEILPLFNSSTIEYFLVRIPGLSEHFLLANDDTFFGAPVGPDFFFEAEGRPIVRLKKQQLRRHLDQIYPYMVYRMQELVYSRFGKRYRLAPHHNVDAYCKRDFEACREFYELKACSRFRDKEDIHRSLFQYTAMAQNRAVERCVDRFNGMTTWWQKLGAVLGFKQLSVDSRCIPVNTPDITAVLDKYRPKLFCLNDGEQVTDDDRKRARKFLETTFPKKSAFEK